MVSHTSPGPLPLSRFKVLAYFALGPSAGLANALTSACTFLSGKVHARTSRSRSSDSRPQRTCSFQTPLTRRMMLQAANCRPPGVLLGTSLSGDPRGLWHRVHFGGSAACGLPFKGMSSSRGPVLDRRKFSFPRQVSGRHLESVLVCCFAIQAHNCCFYYRMLQRAAICTSTRPSRDLNDLSSGPRVMPVSSNLAYRRPFALAACATSSLY